MHVLAHRANSRGPDPASENSLSAVRGCVARGWGLEVDIRRSPDGRFYLSHDPAVISAATAADPFLPLFRQCRVAPVAINVKELGYEAELIEFLTTGGVLPHVFFFDMELIEAEPGVTANTFRALSDSVGLAARVSDRGEPISRALGIGVAQIVWLDEFDALWAGEGDVEALKRAGKTVYAVSPELHGFALQDAVTRWHQFARWGVDGICTDYAELLSTELGLTRGQG